MFIPNPRFPSDYEQSDEAKTFLMSVGGEVVTQAQGLAPVNTGAYEASIGVQEADTGHGVWVVAADWKAGFVEFGTSRTPAFAPLRRGAEATGLTVEAKRGGA